MRAASPFFLTDAQLASEIARCEYCAEKPCREACPADCSPADFIMAAQGRRPARLRARRRADHGGQPARRRVRRGVPGHALHARLRPRHLRPPGRHPRRAGDDRREGAGARRDAGARQARGERQARGRRRRGARGAAGRPRCSRRRATRWTSSRRGARGGMAALIPDFRLDQDVLTADLAFVVALGAVTLQGATRGRSRRRCSRPGYDAVVVTTGLDRPIRLGIPGEELARALDRVPRDSGRRLGLRGRRVAVVGGGAVAADCAETAAARRRRERRDVHAREARRDAADGARSAPVCCAPASRSPGASGSPRSWHEHGAVTGLRTRQGRAAARRDVPPLAGRSTCRAREQRAPRHRRRRSSRSAPGRAFARGRSGRRVLRRRRRERARPRWSRRWRPARTPRSEVLTRASPAGPGPGDRAQASKSRAVAAAAAAPCRCRSTRTSSAGRSSRRSCSRPRRPPTATSRCRRRTRRAGPAAS